MYVVAGVSGNTGKVVAETLLAQGQPVRVVVRTLAKGEAWKARGADVAVADLDDADALGNALRGAKGAYLLLPPQMASTDSRKDNARRAAAIAKAIDASGVAHVVFLSSVGAQHDAGTGPIASAHDAEVALRGTKAGVTFVRAAYFMENLGTSLYDLPNGRFPTFLAAKTAIPMVASHDVGTTAAKALLEGGTGKHVLELSGPRTYAPDDVAAALARITGKSVVAAEGPEEAIVPALRGAGLNAHWAELYREMIHGVNVGRVAFEGGSARAVHGTTDVETVLRGLLGA